MKHLRKLSRQKADFWLVPAISRRSLFASGLPGEGQRIPNQDENMSNEIHRPLNAFLKFSSEPFK